MDLSRVATREKLVPRREPYWAAVATGEHLGFRRTTTAQGGTWLARAYDPATRKQRYKALGDYRTLPASDRYGAALKDAQEWFRHLGGGGQHEVLTLREACERYAAAVGKKKGAKYEAEALARFRRYVFPDPIARIPLPKLRRHDLQGWRDRLSGRPALISRSNKRDAEVRTRERSAATLNRDLVPVRAALRMALADGYVLSDVAWRAALKPEKASGRRNVYLDKDQRRALIDKLEPEIRPFVEALCYLPIRPGALAKLAVKDFDPRQRTVRIESDKAGGGRSILLPHATSDFLKRQARGKLPGAPLLARPDGRPWDKDSWKRPLKQAAAEAGLPEATTAYTIRHSTITDLVTGGLDLLTVAQVSGTSVAMIERHYGQLRRERAAEALAQLSLNPA